MPGLGERIEKFQAWMSLLFGRLAFHSVFNYMSCTCFFDIFLLGCVVN